MEVSNLGVEELRKHYTAHERAKVEYEKNIVKILEEKQTELDSVQQDLAEAKDNLTKLSESHEVQINELQEANERELQESINVERAIFDRKLEDIGRKHIEELKAKDEQIAAAKEASKASIDQLEVNLEVERKRYGEFLKQIDDSMSELEKSHKKLEGWPDDAHSKGRDYLNLQYDEVVKQLHNAFGLESEYSEINKDYVEDVNLHIKSIQEQVENFWKVCKDELRKGDLEMETRHIEWTKEKQQNRAEVNGLHAKIDSFENRTDYDETIWKLNADLEASKLEIEELKGEIVSLKSDIEKNKLELSSRPKITEEHKDGNKDSNESQMLVTEDQEERFKLKSQLVELQNQLIQAESDTMYSLFVERRYKKHTVIKEKTVRVDDSKKFLEEINKLENEKNLANKQLEDSQESLFNTLAEMSSLKEEIEKLRDENRKLRDEHTIFVEKKYQKHTIVKEKIVRPDPEVLKKKIEAPLLLQIAEQSNKIDWYEDQANKFDELQRMLASKIVDLQDSLVHGGSDVLWSQSQEPEQFDEDPATFLKKQCLEVQELYDAKINELQRMKEDIESPVLMLMRKLEDKNIEKLKGNEVHTPKELIQTRVLHHNNYPGLKDGEKASVTSPLYLVTQKLDVDKQEYQNLDIEMGELRQRHNAKMKKLFAKQALDIDKVGDPQLVIIQGLSNQNEGVHDGSLQQKFNDLRAICGERIQEDDYFNPSGERMASNFTSMHSSRSSIRVPSADDVKSNEGGENDTGSSKIVGAANNEALAYSGKESQPVRAGGKNPMLFVIQKLDGDAQSIKEILDADKNQQPDDGLIKRLAAEVAEMRAMCVGLMNQLKGIDGDSKVGGGTLFIKKPEAGKTESIEDLGTKSMGAGLLSNVDEEKEQNPGNEISISGKDLEVSAGCLKQQLKDLQALYAQGSVLGGKNSRMSALILVDQKQGGGKTEVDEEHYQNIVKLLNDMQRNMKEERDNLEDFKVHVVTSDTMGKRLNEDQNVLGYSSKLEKVNNSENALFSEILNLKDEMIRKDENNTKKLNELRSLHETILKELTVSNARKNEVESALLLTIKQLKDEKKTSCDEQIKNLAEELKQLRVSYEDKIHNLKNDHTKELENLVSQLLLMTQKLKDESNEKGKIGAENYESEFAELLSSYEKRLQQLQEQFNSENNRTIHHGLLFAELRKMYEMKSNDIKEKSAHENEREQLLLIIQKLKDKLKEQDDVHAKDLEKQWTELRAVYDTSFKELRENQSHWKEQIEAPLIQKIQNLQNENEQNNENYLKNLEMKMTEMREMYEAKLKDLEASHLQEKENIKILSQPDSPLSSRQSKIDEGSHTILDTQLADLRAIFEAPFRNSAEIGSHTKQKEESAMALPIIFEKLNQSGTSDNKELEKQLEDLRDLYKDVLSQLSRNHAHKKQSLISELVHKRRKPVDEDRVTEDDTMLQNKVALAELYKAKLIELEDCYVKEIQQLEEPLAEISVQKLEKEGYSAEVGDIISKLLVHYRAKLKELQEIIPLGKGKTPITLERKVLDSEKLKDGVSVQTMAYQQIEKKEEMKNESVRVVAECCQCYKWFEATLFLWLESLKIEVKQNREEQELYRTKELSELRRIYEAKLKTLQDQLNMKSSSKIENLHDEKQIWNEKIDVRSHNVQHDAKNASISNQEWTNIRDNYDRNFAMMTDSQAHKLKELKEEVDKLQRDQRDPNLIHDRNLETHFSKIRIACESIFSNLRDIDDSRKLNFGSDKRQIEATLLRKIRMLEDEKNNLSKQYSASLQKILSDVQSLYENILKDLSQNKSINKDNFETQFLAIIKHLRDEQEKNNRYISNHTETSITNHNRVEVPAGDLNLENEPPLLRIIRKLREENILLRNSYQQLNNLQSGNTVLINEFRSTHVKNVARPKSSADLVLRRAHTAPAGEINRIKKEYELKLLNAEQEIAGLRSAGSGRERMLVHPAEQSDDMKTPPTRSDQAERETQELQAKLEKSKSTIALLQKEIEQLKKSNLTDSSRSLPRGKTQKEFNAYLEQLRSGSEGSGKESEVRVWNIELEAKYAQAAEMVVGMESALSRAHKKHEEANAELKKLRLERDKALNLLQREKKKSAFFANEGEKQKKHIRKLELEMETKGGKTTTVKMARSRTMSEKSDMQAAAYSERSLEQTKAKSEVGRQRSWSTGSSRKRKDRKSQRAPKKRSKDALKRAQSERRDKKPTGILKKYNTGRSLAGTATTTSPAPEIDMVSYQSIDRPESFPPSAKPLAHQNDDVDDLKHDEKTQDSHEK